MDSSQSFTVFSVRCFRRAGLPSQAEISGLTLEALQPLMDADCDPLFSVNKTGLHYWAARLFEAAQPHGFTRKRGQGLGTLRKLHATEVCRTLGLDAAAASLGHVGGSTIARRHYVQQDAIAKPKLCKEITRRLTG